MGRMRVEWNCSLMLKSRDITLPTKVHLVKAMVFPVVRYGCESWTVKKAEEMEVHRLLEHEKGREQCRAGREWF